MKPMNLPDDLAAKKEREAYIAKVRSELITEKQKVKLQWFDYLVREGMTKGEAHDAIDECVRQNPEKERQYQNRSATAEQWKELHKLGHRDKTPLTYSDARFAIQNLRVCDEIDELGSVHELNGCTREGGSDPRMG